MLETTKRAFGSGAGRRCLLVALFVFQIYFAESKGFTPDKVGGWLAILGPEYNVERCIVSDITAETVHCYDLDKKEMRAIKLKQVAFITMQRNGIDYLITFSSSSTTITVKNEKTNVVEGEYEARLLYQFMPRMVLPETYEYYTTNGIYYVRPKTVTPKTAKVSKRRFFIGMGIGLEGDDYIGWSMLVASPFTVSYFDVLYNRKKFQDGNNYVENNMNKFMVGTGFRVLRFVSVVGSLGYYRGNVVTTPLNSVQETTEKIREFAYGGGLLLNINIKKKSRIGLGANYEFSPMTSEWVPYLRGYFLF